MVLDLKNADLKSLHQFWDGLRSISGEAHWRDFDVARLPPSVWPRLMVIDVIDEPCRFRARLIGTYIVDAFGRNSTGCRFVDSEISGIEGTDYLKSLHLVADSNKPDYSFRKARHQLRYEYEFAELLSLPFINDEGAVSVIVTGVDYIGFREKFMTRPPS